MNVPKHSVFLFGVSFAYVPCLFREVQAELLLFVLCLVSRQHVTCVSWKGALRS